MADELIPQDPLGSDKVVDGRVDGLEARIAQLEAAQTAKSLSAEDEYNRLLRHEVKQRIAMRYAAIVIGVVVIGVMIGFALHSLRLYFVGPFVLVHPTVAVALFVAPIISVSAITIMLLIGAFRRFKDDDIEQINAQAVLEAAKTASGN